MAFLNTNTFKVVGTLANADVRTANRNNKDYVSVNLTIKSNIDGHDYEYEVGLYANRLTKDGKESSLYNTYVGSADLIGKKVEVTGSLRENRFFSTNANQMVSTQLLSGRWFRGVPESTPDEGSFEIGGFVVASVVEKKTKDGNIYRYDIQLGQTNYSGNSINIYTLHVDPNAPELVRGIQGYKIGDTVSLNGKLCFTVETVTQEVNNQGGFGAPVVRTFTNRQRNFYVIGGSAPIQAPDERVYDMASIKNFINAYKANDIELANHAKSNASSAAEPVVNRQPDVTLSLL